MATIVTMMVRYPNAVVVMPGPMHILGQADARGIPPANTAVVTGAAEADPTEIAVIIAAE